MSRIDWIAVCRLEDIPRAGARRVARPRGLPVALFRTGADRVYALLDRCPHEGGPLSQGLVHGDHVSCPLHQWNIGLADGAAQAPDEGRTPSFRVRLEGGWVQLDAEELAGRALELAAPQAGPGAGCGGGCEHACAGTA